MGFDYEIVYKFGKENVAINAVFRISGTKMMNMELSVISFDLEKRIKASYQIYPFLMKVI